MGRRRCRLKWGQNDQSVMGGETADSRSDRLRSEPEDPGSTDANQDNKGPAQ
jgi:hypothetical protein